MMILGHCRRRKIRCIPEQGDAQNRCSNCIRLKKECNFYPVDQQPQVEPKRRSSKTQSGTGRVSASSSPATSASQLPDIQVDLPYPHLSMPGASQVKRQRTESFSPENKGLFLTASQLCLVLTHIKLSLHVLLNTTQDPRTGWLLMCLRALARLRCRRRIGA